MDRNICYDGTPTVEGKTCLVAYNSSGEAKDVGPVTTMTYLNNATSTWENIDNLNLIYDDEGKNFVGFSINGKARMPYYSEVGGSNGTNEYLYENLDGYDWCGMEGKQPTSNISEIYGYWTLSSYDDNSTRAWYVNQAGYVLIDGADYVGLSNTSGVRPVITLDL